MTAARYMAFYAGLLVLAAVTVIAPLSAGAWLRDTCEHFVWVSQGDCATTTAQVQYAC